ncbi:MAG: DUF3450 domain-containing protein [Hyphomonadaceae bacterium]
MKIGLIPARGALAAALIVGVAAFPAQSQLRSALDTGEQATRRAEQVQARINQLDDERSDMVREYRTLLQKTDASVLYARQQQKVVESQRREIASLEEQLTRVDEITAQMIPMMETLISDLKAFVAADLPFKQDIRQARLDALDAAMVDPQIPPAEAYRLIIEAYQAEMEYGNTVDTWEHNITLDDGEAVTVEMFQYGRVSLVYMSPDRRYAARWDRGTSAWVPLDGKYKDDVAQAIRVAKGLAQQEVLYAPVQQFTVQ